VYDRLSLVAAKQAKREDGCLSGLRNTTEHSPGVRLVRSLPGAVALALFGRRVRLVIMHLDQYDGDPHPKPVHPFLFVENSVSLK
jgi:hypothetical protein